MENPFFKNLGPFSIDTLLKKAGVINNKNFKKDKIYNVKDLSSATNKDLTFFHSKIIQISLHQLKLHIV